MRWILQNNYRNQISGMMQIDMDYRGIYNHVPDTLANMNILVNWKAPVGSNRVKVSNYRTNKWTDIIFDINTADKDLVVQAAKGLDQNMNYVRVQMSRDILKNITTFTLSSKGSGESKENKFIEVNIDKLWSGGQNSEEWLSYAWEEIIETGGMPPWQHS